MRLRRKAIEVDEASAPTEADAGSTPSAEAPAGPRDVGDVPTDQHPPLDLGALLLAPSPGRDLRVQVDEKSGNVRAVLLADKSGAVELRAFAAPRNGDLWSEVRPQIAADTARRGGTATEREGRFGTELVCEVQVKRSDGAQGTQVSRVVGVNGPRWLLRATFLGEPARNAEAAADWDAALDGVVVRRGDHAMPVGEQLPLALPEGIQRAEQPAEKPTG